MALNTTHNSEQNPSLGMVGGGAGVVASAANDSPFENDNHNQGDSLSAEQMISETIARQTAIEHIISGMPFDADKTELIQMSAQLGTLAANMQGNLADGNYQAVFSASSSVNTIIGQSKAEERDSETAEEERTRKHNFATAMRYATYGVAATTVLSNSELTQFISHKFDSIKDVVNSEFDRKYGDLSQTDQDDLSLEKTVGVEDVVESTSTEIDAQIEHIKNLEGVDPEQKAKMIRGLEFDKAVDEYAAKDLAIDGGEITQTQENSLSYIYEKTSDGNNLSEQEKAALGEDKPELTTKEIMVDGVAEKVVVLKDPKTGKVVDSAYVQDLKEELGVGSLNEISDADFEKLSPARQKEVANAKALEYFKEHEKIEKESMAEIINEDKQKTLNQDREKTADLEGKEPTKAIEEDITIQAAVEHKDALVEKNLLPPEHASTAEVADKQTDLASLVKSDDYPNISSLDAGTNGVTDNVGVSSVPNLSQQEQGLTA